ncbi:MAG: hypothetical protein AUJ57_10485 [Zetaproteobacteria bacterium CG1_02_53_45]|nr:MAG: hypothetical protein AUJ57_10485 [Zetaproteobacteria bacterium CG1_02_53_45]
MKGLLIPAALRISVKVLLSIVLSEALIMGGLYLLPVELSPLHKTVVDTLLLGLIAAAVIHLWVVRPLKQAKQQNSLFNTLVNNLDSGLVVTRPHGHGQSIIYVNPAFERITGYRLEEIVGKNPRLLQGDDVDQEALAATRSAMRESRSVRVLQKNRRKNGEPFWNDLHLNPIMGGGGKVDYWVGLIHDVTATRALERENLRWASALKGSGEAVCVFDIDGVIEYANAAYCRNARLPLEQLTGSSIMGFWQRGPEFDSFIASIKQQQPWSGRHKRLRGDQSSYESLTTVTPIGDEDGSLAFVGVHRDISDMVLMEEKLRQSQKMEAVGMLVSGIAHDFNNVLAGILGNLYLIKRHLKEDPKMFRRIEGVEGQGYAAAGMIRQLLSFARQGAVDSKKC